MTLGSRIAFATWKLYRTSAVARRFLDPMIRRSAEKGLSGHEAFVERAAPSPPWTTPRETAGGPLTVSLAGAPLDRDRLVAVLNHWRARYVVRPGGDSSPLAVGLVPDDGLRSGRVVFGAARDGDHETTLEQLAAARHPIALRAPASPGRPPLLLVVDEEPSRRVILPPEVLSPAFLASPWGCVVADALDWALESSDWRDPLPPLVSARIDDVTGEKGLAWLRAFEERGIRPSLGTLHDRWLAGPSVEALVAASRRGVSVSPHAFDMDRFIWFDAHSARPFSNERMDEHRGKIERDVAATGLLLGQTLNCHFDVFGETALAAAHRLGFRYVLGEHRPGQDWREAPRARGPLGTPLYCYERVGPLLAFQAEGAIASSAARRSRYDWLRNFLAVDRRTNLPVKESLDRAGAVRQGVTQLLSALHAGFPGYLLAHEVHLDVLGGDVVAELLDEVLREVRERVPGMKTAAFDELPRACEGRV